MDSFVSAFILSSVFLSLISRNSLNFMIIFIRFFVWEHPFIMAQYQLPILLLEVFYGRSSKFIRNVLMILMHFFVLEYLFLMA